MSLTQYIHQVTEYNLAENDRNIQIICNREDKPDTENSFTIQQAMSSQHALTTFPFSLPRNFADQTVCTGDSFLLCRRCSVLMSVSRHDISLVCNRSDTASAHTGRPFTFAFTFTFSVLLLLLLKSERIS